MLTDSAKQPKKPRSAGLGEESVDLPLLAWLAGERYAFAIIWHPARGTGIRAFGDLMAFPGRLISTCLGSP